MSAEGQSGQFIPQMRQYLPVIFKVLGIIIAFMIFVSLVIYGVSVYFENRVIKLGKETRNVQEDNQDLQISLDRLRSYQKVADASAKLQGLQVADEVIDVVQKARYRYKPLRAPAIQPPKEAYGY
jgi:cell division protein FtsL